MSATTPEEIYENNFAVRLGWGGDGRYAREVVESWILEGLVKNKEPRLMDVQRLKKLGGLKPVDKNGRLLHPDARFEMIHLEKARAFFRKDLTLAGFHNYRGAIEEIFTGVMERKRLSQDELASIQSMNYYIPASDSTSARAGHPPHGYINTPYPGMRYWSVVKIGEEWIQFIFDTNYELIALLKDGYNNGTPIWELPGARHPELYS